MTLTEIEPLTILRSVVGSTACGLNLEEGGDRDEMGVCLEPIEGLVGFHTFDQLVHRTAAIREGRHDAPSQPGDLDLTIYGLRKFLSLALKGNPTILLLLYTEPFQCDALGTSLLALAPSIVSRKAGSAFLGYMQAQRERLLGERGGKDVNRADLVEKFGFDTKFAMHMLRLGFQGVELLSEGKITMPCKECERQILLRVREGKVSLNECVQLGTALEADLKDAIDTGPLPEFPDTKGVEKWMLSTYLASWHADAESKRPLPPIRSLEERRAAIEEFKRVFKGVGGSHT